MYDRPMKAALPEPGETIATADQRIVTSGVPWSHYEAMMALRGEGRIPRMAYLDGVLEQMSPSRHHERLASFIGRLVEVWCLENDVDFSPYGSWTLKSAPKEAGVEADECYIVGDQGKEVPDLAIEVVWTRGGIDKLEIYRRLAVGEVWFWEKGRITVYVLRGERYEAAERSALFPGLDLALLLSFLDAPSAAQAIKAYRKALQG